MLMDYVWSALVLPHPFHIPYSLLTTIPSINIQEPPPDYAFRSLCSTAGLSGRPSSRTVGGSLPIAPSRVSPPSPSVIYSLLSFPISRPCFQEFSYRWLSSWDFQSTLTSSAGHASKGVFPRPLNFSHIGIWHIFLFNRIWLMRVARFAISQNYCQSKSAQSFSSLSFRSGYPAPCI